MRFGFYLVFCAVSAAWAGLPTTLTAAALADEVVAVNPMVAAASAQARRASHEAGASGLWEDPAFMVERMLPPEAPEGTVMPGWAFGVRQQFPLPPVSVYERRQARAKAAAAAADAEAARLMAVMEAKHAYFELYEAAAMRELVSEERDLWRDYERVAAARYAAGMGSYADVLKAEVEQTRAAAKLLDLERRESAARARINALLGREGGEPLPPLGGLPDIELSFNLDELYAKARAQNPTVRAAERRLAAAEAMRTLAGWELAPEIAAVGRYERNDEGEMAGSAAQWTVGGEVMVPLFGTVAGVQNKRAAEADARAMAAELEAARANAAAQVAELYSAAANYNKQSSLINDELLPRAEAALRASVAGYEAGVVEFPMLLENVMTLYELKMEYIEARVMYHETLASLEAAVGERFY